MKTKKDGKKKKHRGKARHEYEQTFTEKQRREMAGCLNCTIPVKCCTGDPKTCKRKYEYEKNRKANQLAALDRKRERQRELREKQRELREKQRRQEQCKK